MIVQFASQVFTTLFGTSAAGPQLFKKVYGNLGPWPIEQYEYKGGNYFPPLVRQFKWRMPATPPEVRQKRMAYLRIQGKQKWTEEQYQEDLEKKREYHRRVGKPLVQFQKRARIKGYTREEVFEMTEPFRVAARMAKKEGKPAPKPELYLPL